jgi:hypothetical protein
MEQMNAKGMLPSQPNRPEPHPKAHMDAHMDDTFSSEDPALHGGYSTRPGSEFQTDRGK